MLFELSQESVISLIGLGATALTALLVINVQSSIENDKAARLSAQERRSKAFDFFEYFSGLLDRRIYAMRRVKYALDENTSVQLEEAAAQYKDVIMEWNSAPNSNLAKIEVYFGHGSRMKFEKDLAKEFIALGSLTERFIRKQEFEESLESFWEKIDSLNSDTYEFEKSLLDLLVRDKFRKD